MNGNPNEEFTIPDDWKWLAERIDTMSLGLALGPRTVTIQCVQGTCVVDPKTINAGANQVVRFEAIATNAHVFNPNPELSPVDHLVIPAGQWRPFPISPSAKLNHPYPYIVFCESCGLNCPGPGPDTPKMIVQ